METVRLFTAIEIPLELKRKITALPNLKLDFQSRAHPDDLHITLKFLGDVDVAMLPVIEDALADMKKPKKFGMEVSGLGLFSKKDKKVLYAAVPSVRQISLLADQIAQRVMKAGIVLEQKPYIPHVTIARLNNDKNFEVYKKQHDRSIHAQWNVTAFHLMRSAIKAEGEKRYSIVQTYELPNY